MNLRGKAVVMTVAGVAAHFDSIEMSDESATDEGTRMLTAPALARAYADGLNRQQRRARERQLRKAEK